MSDTRISRLETAGRWANPPSAATSLLLQNLMHAYAFFTDAGDEARLADLFTPDATYRDDPADEPLRGREAIVDSWLKH